MNSIGLTTAHRIREVFLDGTFIANTNYHAQLSGIDRSTATATIYGSNSIAMLTYHINYYLNGLLEAFSTGQLTIRDKFSFDLPDSGTEEEWQDLVLSLLQNARCFAHLVESLPEERFAEPFIDPRYGTVARNVEAVIEHSYYHLGQIVLLNKILRRLDKEG
jgi:hypothetical protein